MNVERWNSPPPRCPRRDVCACVCMHIFIDANIYMYAYIYIYVYTHGCLYLYIHIWHGERPDCLQRRVGSTAWAVGSSQAVATVPLSSQGQLPVAARPSEHLRLLSQISLTTSVHPQGEPSLAMPVLHGHLHPDRGCSKLLSLLPSPAVPQEP